jgi:transglutaminase-like putative cysteine protease
MPLVRVVHTTEYRYRHPVRLTSHRLMLRPHDSHDLRLLDATLGLDPPSAATRWATDAFGNSVCHIDFDNAAAERLRIVSTLELEHYPPTSELPIDPVAEFYPFAYAFDEFPDLARLIERQHPDPERRVDRWARRFQRTGQRTHTLELLIAITQAIQSDFSYAPRDAEGTNPPLRTLAEGRGACRDFALLMMEAVRSLGFAARFISGYLYPADAAVGGEPVTGGGATHAWCAIYLPGAGWVEFDPTNGLIAGRNLIRVAVSRTPEQSIPVSGGFIGQLGDDLGLLVEVQVSVSTTPPVNRAMMPA